MTWFYSKQPYTGSTAKGPKSPGRRETPKSYWYVSKAQDPLLLKPHRLWIKRSANSQKFEFKNFQKISILAHSARDFFKVNTSKIFPGQTLSPCQISKESVNHKDFYEHFNNFLILNENFWDESGAAMVRDRHIVSLAKMMLMSSSFRKINVPKQLKLPCLKIKKIY